MRWRVHLRYGPGTGLKHAAEGRHPATVVFAGILGSFSSFSIREKGTENLSLSLREIVIMYRILRFFRGFFSGIIGALPGRDGVISFSVLVSSDSSPCSRHVGFSFSRFFTWDASRRIGSEAVLRRFAAGFLSHFPSVAPREGCTPAGRAALLRQASRASCSGDRHHSMDLSTLSIVNSVSISRPAYWTGPALRESDHKGLPASQTLPRCGRRPRIARIYSAPRMQPTWLGARDLVWPSWADVLLPG